MYSILVVGPKNFFPRSILDEGIGEACLVQEFAHLEDLFPMVLGEDPLVAVIDGNALDETDIGMITILRKTFPPMRILVTSTANRREILAKTIVAGADAYLLEPYFMDEAAQLIRRAFDGARREVKHTVQMRMEALSLFIQGLAPEINNRLTPVLGSLQLLLGKNGDKLNVEERRENYECIYRESLRIARILDELENFARPRKPKKNQVSLRETIDRALAEANEESANEVPIENDFQATRDRILIDPSRIIQALKAVILFLKENADEDEGRITVSTFTLDPDTFASGLGDAEIPNLEAVARSSPAIPDGREGEESDGTRISGYAADAGRLHITVQGHHTVILGEEAQHAFIPLYLRRVVRFGHELGLASAYGLVRAHGGELKIKSTAIGTKIHVSIPLESLPRSTRKKTDKARKSEES